MSLFDSSIERRAGAAAPAGHREADRAEQARRIRAHRAHAEHRGMLRLRVESFAFDEVNSSRSLA